MRPPLRSSLSARRLLAPFAITFVGVAVALGGCGASGETTGDTASTADGPAPSTDDGGSTTVPAVDTTAPEPDADPAVACTLLTDAEVEEAFGEAVTGGESDDADECWWETATGLKSVNVKVDEPDPDEWRAAHENDSWEPVDLGDEGYVGVGVFSTVELRVGDRTYEVNVTYSTSGDADAAALALAEDLAARL